MGEVKRRRKKKNKTEGMEQNWGKWPFGKQIKSRKRERARDNAEKERDRNSPVNTLIKNVQTAATVHDC